MPSDPLQSPKLEIAHVLLLDIVGYSLRPMEEQKDQIQSLQGILRGSRVFRRVEADGDLIRLPTGDGMALVFFSDPVAPAECAMEVAGALWSQPALKLRMGIHTGPVYRVTDINASANVAGAAINFAQRVMDCGDAGHILLSSSTADILTQLQGWPERLHDLGECQVKHGVRLHLYSLFTDDVGNSGFPSRLRASQHPVPQAEPAAAAPPIVTPPTVTPAAVEPPRSPSAPVAPSVSTDQVPALNKVALLYKRHAQPDDHLLALLEAQLNAHGYQVFIDRHLSIGVEWAKEIERQMCSSDAVIPLISAASIQSEMLAYELNMAHTAAQQQEGRPRLLPVRVRYTGALPQTLAPILDPLHYAAWEGPEDDERLVAELLNALRNPPTPRVALPPEKLETAGGVVPLDSQFYVVRPTDAQFQAAIARRESIVLVKGARQMGKTSLLARGLQQARQAGARVILTDFQLLNATHLASAEALFLALGAWMADQLNLDVMPEEVWRPGRGPSINFQRYLQAEVLGKVPEPIVWGLDEVDRLFTCDFGSEVFGMFRSWHNARHLDPTAAWSRLTLAIAYATEAHLFITDVNQSPFNVGTRLTLADFSREQVADLNERHGRPLRNEAEVTRFYDLVSGHPYLVRRGLHAMAEQSMELAAFEEQATRDEGIYGDHLRRILVLLARDTDLCDIVRDVLQGRPCPTVESFYRLRSAGVMAGESTRDAQPRCQLYATYLGRHLL